MNTNDYRELLRAFYECKKYCLDNSKIAAWQVLWDLKKEVEDVESEMSENIVKKERKSLEDLYGIKVVKVVTADDLKNDINFISAFNAAKAEDPILEFLYFADGDAAIMQFYNETYAI